MPGKFTFYTENIQDSRAFFDDNEFRHAISALRFELRDTIEFTDGKGRLFKGKISTIGKKEFEAIVEEQKFIAQKPGLHLAVGLIKSADRMEWLVEKCTEVGAKSLTFIHTNNAERTKLNLPRMHKVSVAALKQSHGVYLPQISSESWANVLNRSAEMRCIAWVGAQNSTSWSKICGMQKETLLLIGPEGDFTDAEKKEAQSAGFQPVSLGETVLRTETACMAAAAAYALS